MREGGLKSVSFRLALFVAYAAGFVGWVWDWLEHLGGGESVGGHLLMYAGLVVVLAVSVVWVVVDRGALRAVAAGLSGLLVAIVGVVVDMIWHQANPGAEEANMLLMPGHLIEVVGWMVGLAVIGALLLRSRSRAVGSPAGIRRSGKS